MNEILIVSAVVQSSRYAVAALPTTRLEIQSAAFIPISLDYSAQASASLAHCSAAALMVLVLVAYSLRVWLLAVGLLSLLRTDFAYGLSFNGVGY